MRDQGDLNFLSVSSYTALAPFAAHGRQIVAAAERTGMPAEHWTHSVPVAGPWERPTAADYARAVETFDALGEEAPWRPIEYASRDGRSLLLWDPYYLMRVGRWEDRVVLEAKVGFSAIGADARRVLATLPADAPGAWLTDLPYGFERGEFECALDPTHFCALPQPPQPPRSSTSVGSRELADDTSRSV